MSRLPLPRPGSNRGYQPEDLIEACMCGVVMGSRRLAHTGMLLKKQNALLRFDSGFFSQKIMKLLETQDKPIPNIIRGRMTPGIAQLIQDQTAWYANNDVVQGAEYCTATYQALTWDQPRKIVNVFVTSVTFSASVVHSLYNKRANAENRIKDLKCDDGLLYQPLINWRKTRNELRSFWLICGLSF